jgi:hypothetical protein
MICQNSHINRLCGKGEAFYGFPLNRAIKQPLTKIKHIFKCAPGLLLLFLLCFMIFVPSKTLGVEPKRNRAFFILNPINIITPETDATARSIAPPSVRGESLAFFITSKTLGGSMKQNNKANLPISPLLRTAIDEINVINSLLRCQLDSLSHLSILHSDADHHVWLNHVISAKLDVVSDYINHVADQLLNQKPGA